METRVNTNLVTGCIRVTHYGFGTVGRSVRWNLDLGLQADFGLQAGLGLQTRFWTHQLGIRIVGCLVCTLV